MGEHLGVLQAEVVSQVGGLESSLSRTMETMGRHLVSMGETLQGIRQNTYRGAAGPAMPPPPHFRPVPPPADGGIPMPGSGGNDGVHDVPMPDLTEMSTGGTPITPGGVPFAPGGTAPLPGYASGPASSHVSVPLTVAKAGAVPGRSSASSSGTDLVSIFLCFCPDVVGNQRPTTPANMEVPSQRQGIYTRDAGTGQVCVLSPTVYDTRAAARITAAWAPKGLAVLRDQRQQVRRIY